MSPLFLTSASQKAFCFGVSLLAFGVAARAGIDNTISFFYLVARKSDPPRPPLADGVGVLSIGYSYLVPCCAVNCLTTAME